jgi:GNAT superfamily N-acetyltransferase
MADIQGGAMQTERTAQDQRREIRLRKTRALLNNPLDLAVNYSIARERETFEEAFHLVYQAYTEVGLQAENEARIRFTKYHVVPTTKVFVAVFRPELTKPDFERQNVNADKRVVGTLTLVLDSSLGMPVEQVCAPEIQDMRDRGSRMAEVIALAIDPQFRRHNVMMYLYKIMFEYARLRGVTDICCAVTRRHIEFYRDILLFRPLGQLLPYDAGNGLEVQGHVLNIEHAFGDSKATYSTENFDANVHDFFFAGEVDHHINEGQPWDEAMIHYFLAEKTRFIDTLSDPEKAKIRSEYEKQNLVFPY